MTLTEFLLARLAEDEAVAKAATAQRWKRGEGWGAGMVEADDEIIVYDEGRPSESDADHIARHDPARVLAECEAKRQIVEHFTPDVDAGGFEQWDAGVDARPTLRALALPYADHPDYDEAWRP